MSKHIKVKLPMLIGDRHFHPIHDPIAEVDDKTAARIVGLGQAEFLAAVPGPYPLPYPKQADPDSPSSKATEAKPKGAGKATAK